jgi:hypothetical protein
MKKVLFSALLLAGLSTITSCKKDHACSCSTVTTVDGVSETSIQIVSLGEKMKEKQGEASCDQTEIQMNTLNDELVADTSNVSYDDLTTTCDLL